MVWPLSSWSFTTAWEHESQISISATPVLSVPSNVTRHRTWADPWTSWLKRRWGHTGEEGIGGRRLHSGEMTFKTKSRLCTQLTAQPLTRKALQKRVLQPNFCYGTLYKAENEVERGQGHNFQAHDVAFSFREEGKASLTCPQWAQIISYKLHGAGPGKSCSWGDKTKGKEWSLMGLSCTSMWIFQLGGLEI